MKNFAITAALTILMASCLSSCGKKANENKSKIPEEKSEKVETDLIEETHKELVAAIIARDQAKVMKLLEFKNQLDLNKILEDGETLLTLAVRHNLTRISEELIENGAIVSRTNVRRENPLMVAAKFGHEGLLKILISLGAKLDAKDMNGNTALQLAIINKYEDIAMYLIEKGANIDITNNDDQTALRLAEMLDLKRVLAYLRSKTQSNMGMPDELTLTDLLTLGDVETLTQLFLRYENLISAYPHLNYYVLVMNAHTHDRALSMIHFLKGLGISVHGAINSTETPLLAAVKLDEVDFANIFLEARANPDVIDPNGKTALVWAIQRNNPSMVKLLLNYSAAEKYDYYVSGKKKTMKACDVARETREHLTSTDQKQAMEEILDALGCGLRWFF